MIGDDPPEWRLPQGVNRALWRYAHTRRLAVEEDDYFAGSHLVRLDTDYLTGRFVDPGDLIDLGCGAGRHSISFARRDFRVVAVDLSEAMLRVVQEKARRAGAPVAVLRANLCDLGCLPDRTFDYAISMFSTLGMVRGAEARRRALCEASRLLRPGGRLALHAHNLWLNLADPQGRRWLASRWRRLVRGDPEAADRCMTYRGVEGLEVHLYRWRELKHDLKEAGLHIEEVLPIDAIEARPIRWPWLAHGLRAGGWVVFASK
jgi:SAM-dependent methyltransferase